MSGETLEMFDWRGLAERSPHLYCGDVRDAVFRCRGALVYLASPYTKIATMPDGRFSPLRSEAAAREADHWVALFAANGVTAVSPISAAVNAMGAASGLDGLDRVFWENWCRPLLQASAAVVVPPIDGWRESEGIWREVVTALRLLRPVCLIGNGRGRA